MPDPRRRPAQQPPPGLDPLIAEAQRRGYLTIEQNKQSTATRSALTTLRHAIRESSGIRRPRPERRRVIPQPRLQGPGRSTRGPLDRVGHHGGVPLSSIGIQLDHGRGPVTPLDRPPAARP